MNDSFMCEMVSNKGNINYVYSFILPTLQLFQPKLLQVFIIL